jgi:hypothetical protein
MVTLWAAIYGEHSCCVAISRFLATVPLGSWLAGLRDRSLRRLSVAPHLLVCISWLAIAVTAGCGFGFAGLGFDAPPALSIGVFTCGRGFRRTYRIWPLCWFLILCDAGSLHQLF